MNPRPTLEREWALPLRMWLRMGRSWIAVATALALLFGARQSRAQSSSEFTEEPSHAAQLEWDTGHQGVYASFEFRNVIDEEVTQKLRRGLPTRILLTALVYTRGSDIPISTTFQSCKITWHVWEDMYRVEVLRPNQPEGSGHWTPTLAGVLRRCATADRLLVADAAQLNANPALRFDVTVRVNPVSEETLGKLKRWVSHPTRTGTAAPGSALFSTFTGLFLQRLGDAEKTVKFRILETTPR